MKQIGVHQSDWDEYLDPILFSVRTSVQESTKFTPFYLMHGREARFPMEAEKLYMTNMGDVEERIDCLSQLKNDIFSKAKKNIDSSQNKQIKQYKKRKGITMTNIQSGKLVLRLNMKKRTKKGHKMEDTWLGPYKVLKVSDTGCCSLSSVKTGKVIKQKVNVSQLKLYVDSAKMNVKEVQEANKPPLSSNKDEDKPDEVDQTKMKQMLQILEDLQLFDDSILRLWRTGAEFKMWESIEDDHSKVCAL